MGEKDIKLIHHADDKGYFVRQILKDLTALQQMMENDQLEKNNPRIGAELELNFLDSEYTPFPIGLDIHNQIDTPAITTEYARFNLEINSDPVSFSGNCFSRLYQNLNIPYKILQKEARRRDGHILLTGIIPTLDKEDITYEALTPEARFKALYEIRKKLHGELYEFHIRGIDELLIRDNIMLFAGCMTSFQVHLQIDPQKLVAAYNWAQMISGPLLSSATYSPLFLGKKLWHETRIALFEQSADVRNHQHRVSNQQPRVNFGNKWIEESVLELFQEDIAIHDPLFICDDPEDPFEELRSGKTPALKAWDFFNGSIYRWNRLRYGVLDGHPSMRIENRILPAGPTMEDQMANAAFWMGMIHGMPEDYKNIQRQFPFDEAKQNFLKAARLGLEVQFKWVTDKPVPAHELILKELLPIAKAGLEKASIDTGEADHYLDIIRERVTSQKTGSNWIINSYNNLLNECKQDEALVALTASMITRQESNQPVHTWEPAKAKETGWESRCNHLHKFMTTSLYRIPEDTVVDLAAHIMEWKKIGNILVENTKGELVGLINKDAIINFVIDKDRREVTRVGEIMISNPITADPETTLEEAIQMILDNDISSLPIVKNKRAVGIVTKHDFIAISKFLVSELNNKDSW